MRTTSTLTGVHTDGSRGLGGGALAMAAGPVRRWVERRPVVLSTAAVLFVVTFVLRELAPGNRDELLGLLFVIPVALVGLELGLRAGVAGALVTTLVLGVLQAPPTEPRLDTTGLAMRGVAFLAVGMLAGRFSDRMWAIQNDMARLLAGERERAALQGELSFARQRLHDQIRSASQILNHHEQERRGIARELHEQAAQTMAAALLVVGRLERDIVDELTQAQLERVRDGVHDCIAELRRLAGSLQSPVLEELGLLPALERLFEREREERSRSIVMRTSELPELPADVEISAYRVIEDTLDACRHVEDTLGAATAEIAVSIGVDEHAGRLRAVIEGGPDCPACGREIEARLATTRARLEMVGGSLRMVGGSLHSSSPAGEPVAIVAELPLASSTEPHREIGDERLAVDASLRHTHSSAG